MQLVFNEIAIIESLPAQEFQTGTDLQRHLTVTAPLPVAVTLLQATTATELLASLHGFAARAEHDGWVPIVHLEIHGNVQGVTTASGERVSWIALSEPLRRINIASRNSLIVVLATCEGAYLATAVAEMPFAAAPFCGIVGPSKPVFSYLLIHGFRAFYAELVHTQNFVSALHQLQQRSLPEYAAFDAADLFRRGRQSYVDMMLKPSVVKERVKRILRKRAR